MGRAVQASLFVSVMSLFGCEMVLELADDPQVVETGPWRCLGKATTPATPTKQTALVRVRACDFISNCKDKVPGAVTAKLCAKRDVGCTSPIMSNISETDGELRFEVPSTGFDGYMEISAPTTRCTEFPADSKDLICGMAVTLQECDLNLPNDPRCKVPSHAQSMLFFNPPVTSDMTSALEMPMLSMANLPTLMQSAGVPSEALGDLTGENSGNLFVTVRDCDGKPAPGVKFSIPAQEKQVFQFYVASGLPTRDATETDASGMGGFVGLTNKKFIEVTAHTADGRLVGKIGVQAARLAMTYSTLPAQ